MADVAPPSSIRDRIAALEVSRRTGPTSPPTLHSAVTSSGHNIAPNNVSARRPPPALPTRRPGLLSSESDDAIATTGIHTANDVGNQPAARPPPSLPARRLANGATPTLPARRPSEAPSAHDRRPSIPLARQDSKESIASVASGHSIAFNKTNHSVRTTSSGGQYTIRAPAYDPSTLPALPARRPNEEAAPTPRASLPTSASTTSVPILPSRKSTNGLRSPEIPRRTEPPPPRKSALSQGFNQGIDRASSIPQRPGIESAANGVPPPIPTASRPDLSQLKLSKPKPNSSPTADAAAAAPSSSQPGCLKCRDFSAADTHASRFPRQSLPNNDLSWLAQQLTSCFPSKTDKARAIFSWCHHNIAYNTEAFFAKNIKWSTPASTIESGLAVCEGYSALFAALALQAGLEARVVSGHGKGIGYEALGPGQPLPPYELTHAWNVVLIDEGWKLIDVCWGAGNVSAETQRYNKAFNPWEFVKDNEDFGHSHFPDDRKSFFRRDGRCPTWEEYLLGDLGEGDGPKNYSGYSTEEGIDTKSITPKCGRISVGQERAKGSPNLRFSMTKICPHWDCEKHGKGKWHVYVVITKIAGKETQRAMANNNWAWWVDVPVNAIGEPGGVVKLMVITQMNGKSTRGMPLNEFDSLLGRCGWAGMGVAEWEVAP